MVIIGIAILFLSAGFTVGMLIERHRWENRKFTNQSTNSDYAAAIKVYREYASCAPLTNSMRCFEKYCNDCLNPPKAADCA